MMDRKYNSVLGMLRDTGEDASLIRRVSRLLSSHVLSKRLAVMRAAKGLTQSELSKKIGCSQSRISKIESSADKQIAVQDLHDYAVALDLPLVLALGKPYSSLTEAVKFHAMMIKNHLDQLGELAGNDPKFVEGIQDFYSEALANILALSMESTSKFSKTPMKCDDIIMMPCIRKFVESVTGASEPEQRSDDCSSAPTPAANPVHA